MIEKKIAPEAQAYSDAIMEMRKRALLIIIALLCLVPIAAIGA